PACCLGRGPGLLAARGARLRPPHPARPERPRLTRGAPRAPVRQDGRMLRIGLTGGIASGKSVALRRFGELGAVVVDHDLLAREAVAPGSVGLDAVVAEFGPGVLAADGTLDRPALARLVFADDDARERLNAIVHPEVRRLSAERDAEAG